MWSSKTFSEGDQPPLPSNDDNGNDNIYAMVMMMEIMMMIMVMMVIMMMIIVMMKMIIMMMIMMMMIMIMIMMTLVMLLLSSRRTWQAGSLMASPRKI